MRSLLKRIIGIFQLDTVRRFPELWVATILVFTVVSGIGEGNELNCNKCHTSFDKAKIRNLGLPMKKEHRELQFHHMENLSNCLMCHAENSVNQFVLLDGSLISSDKYPMLCGQCHGPIYMDWKEGIHGKLINKGKDEARVLKCGECHEPHQPKFKKMKAAQAPKVPKLSVKKTEEE